MKSITAFKRNIINYLKDFSSLIYPDLCNACGTNLYRNEKIICTSCQFHLPVREDHLNPSNELSQLFWGRIPLQAAYAFLNFKKGSKVQTLLHRLKYRQQAEIGIWLGIQHGLLLQQNSCYQTIDYIIPVPLHPNKQKLRTYNQSAKYAEGLAIATQKPVIINQLIRTQATLSQTRKTRFDRFTNTNAIFQFQDPHKFQDKHLLIVDDIITTGATIEAGCTEILRNNTIKLSLASIAFTQS